MMGAEGDRVEIQALLQRYCELLDAGDIDHMVEEVFAADGEFLTQGWRGREAIRDGLAKIWHGWTATAHVPGLAIIELDGQRATLRAYVTAYHWGTDDEHLGPLRPASWVAVGLLEDEVRHQPEGWRVVRRAVSPVGGPVATGAWPSSVPIPTWIRPTEPTSSGVAAPGG